MAILLSLVAAVVYGTSDFLGGLVSGRVSPWTVAVLGQLAGSLAALIATVWFPGQLSAEVLAWSVLAGAGNALGTVTLYRGLATGRMGVVAPVSGVGTAVLPVVAGLVLGERPAQTIRALLVWAGLVLALPAIWLVAREPVTGEARTGMGAGVRDGVLAGVGFGLLFIALSRMPEEAGLLPVVVNQAIATVLVLVAALAAREPVLPRSPLAATGVVVGLLGALATVLFMLASQQGYLSITAVITALYPAATVLLAALVLRERVHRAQALGLVLCASAVALVAAG
jgi:drug/metabolite transporter (DMT)-like permease